MTFASAPACQCCGRPFDESALGPDRLIGIRAVVERAGISKTRIYGYMREGRFPVPTRVGLLSRWSEREVEAWVQARLAERPSAPPAGRSSAERSVTA